MREDDVRDPDAGNDGEGHWLPRAFLEFATIAGLFALLFGVFVLLKAWHDLP